MVIWWIAPNFLAHKEKMRISKHRGILHLTLLRWTSRNPDVPTQWCFYRAYFPLQWSTIKPVRYLFPTFSRLIVLRIDLGQSVKLHHPALLWKLPLIYSSSVKTRTGIYWEGRGKPLQSPYFVHLLPPHFSSLLYIFIYFAKPVWIVGNSLSAATPAFLPGRRKQPGTQTFSGGIFFPCS